MTWISTACPVCGLSVPLFHVTARSRGTFRPQITLEVSGDATDFVAHLWSHTAVKP